MVRWNDPSIVPPSLSELKHHNQRGLASLGGNPSAVCPDPEGVREPQWLGTKYAIRRKGEAMKGG